MEKIVHDTDVAYMLRIGKAFHLLQDWYGPINQRTNYAYYPECPVTPIVNEYTVAIFKITPKNQTNVISI